MEHTLSILIALVMHKHIHLDMLMFLEYGKKLKNVFSVKVNLWECCLLYVYGRKKWHFNIHRIFKMKVQKTLYVGWES